MSIRSVLIGIVVYLVCNAAETQTALGGCTLDGAARDPLYGPALSVQNTQTGFGDSNLGRPDWANGSELDAAYGVVYDGVLYLVLTGNFETNGNRLEIFFDTRPGGQNQLLGEENPDIDYGALQRMGRPDPYSSGLTFAAGFQADYYLTLSASGDPTIIYASYAELYRDAQHPGVAYYLGEGRTKCETNDGALTGGWPGAPAIRCTLDNSNVLGVTGGFDLGDGSGVVTGYELAIPLSAIGDPTGDIAITAFINSPGHDYVSNQVLGGIATGWGANLGDPRFVYLPYFPQAPFIVPLVKTPVGACCIGTACSIRTRDACSGAWRGDNTNCDGNPCDQTPSGRCCIDDGYSGECRVTTQAECAGLGGAYTAGGDCAGCPCLIGPPGGCCVGGTCSIMVEEECAANQGVFVGPFSTCEHVSCTPGACCIVHECSVLYNFQCSAAGGRYRGDGTACQQNTCIQTVPTPTVAGTMNGWNTTANPMTETPPGSHIWTVTFSGLAPGNREEFKITDGTWNNSIPGANSWCYSNGSGEVTITYDSTVYADGWSPAWDRIRVSVDPGAWTAAGDWQGWDNANPLTAMVPQGGGIYMYEGTGLDAGTHYWKAVMTGSWDSVSSDGRSVYTADMAFTIGGPADSFRLWVDALVGRVRVEVCGLGDINQDGIVNGLDIAGFVRAKLGQAPLPGESQICADFGTGTLAGDIAAFVDKLLY